MDDGLGEAAGVVLDADGLFAFVELEMADAVDLADASHGENRALGWRNAVAVENVELSHAASLAGLSRAQAAALLQVREVAGDLRAGPVLRVDELAAENAVLVDDVGFGDLGGTVELVDAAVGVADGGDLDVVIGEEAAVDVVGLVHGDADDGEVGHLFMKIEEAGQLLHAGGAPGGPKIEDDGVAAEFGEIEGLFAIRDGELGSGFRERLWMIAAVAAESEGRQRKGERGGYADVSRRAGTGGMYHDVSLLSIIRSGLARLEGRQRLQRAQRFAMERNERRRLRRARRATYEVKGAGCGAMGRAGVGLDGRTGAAECAGSDGAEARRGTGGGV